MGGGGGVGWAAPARGYDVIDGGPGAAASEDSARERSRTPAVGGGTIMAWERVRGYILDVRRPPPPGENWKWVAIRAALSGAGGLRTLQRMGIDLLNHHTDLRANERVHESVLKTTISSDFFVKLLRRAIFALA